jgi:hypothetical protein
MQQLCEPCSYCEGRGYVLSAESVAYKVLREFRRDLPRFCGRQIAVTVHPQVAEILLGKARKAVAALGEQLGREIEVRARPGQHQEQFELTALDEGPPVELTPPWLAQTQPETTPETAPGPEPPEAAVPEAANDEPPKLLEAHTEEPAAVLDDAGTSEAESVTPAEPPRDKPEALEPQEAPVTEPAGEITDGAPRELAAAGAQPDPALGFATDSEPEMLDLEEEKPIIPRSVTPEESS